MNKLKRILRTSINFFKGHKKAVFVGVSLVFVLILFVLINKTLFQNAVSSSSTAASSLVKELEDLPTTSTNSAEIANSFNEIQQSLKVNIEDSSINYPENLAILSSFWPISNQDEIRQLYQNSNTAKNYANGLTLLATTQETIFSLPDKNELPKNTDNFIRQYQSAYDLLQNSPTEVDLTTVTRIVQIVLESAEVYRTTSNIEIFNSRYDNVFSEMEKELIIAYQNYIGNMTSFFDAYSKRLESF